MPGMDGLQMIHELQEEEGKGSPSILMVTAYGEEKLKTAEDQQIIDGYLVKPISASILYDAVQKMLHQKNMIGLKGAVRSNDLSLFKQKLKGARVLLVEDNEINIELAVDLLQEVGIVVTTATNGQEALDKVAQAAFDGILMDIQMPVMDGLTATREIRKDKTMEELPIFAMTAHALAGEREKSLAAGMNDHITKPIDPAKLYQALSNYIEPTRGEDVKTHVETAKEQLGEDQIPTIPGIHIEDGLYRAGGKMKIYKKILLSFSQKYEKLEM